MTKPHEHKDLILKWADGAEIEAYDEGSGKWVPATTPVWQAGTKYRVKPAAPLVETKMTEKERFDAAVGDPISCVAISIYTTLGGDYTPTFTKNLADAAIARAIADGDLFTRGFIEGLAEEAAAAVPGPGGFSTTPAERASMTVSILRRWLAKVKP